MAFYSFEMILVGIILLSAMALGGIKLRLNKRKDSVTKADLTEDTKPHHL